MWIDAHMDAHTPRTSHTGRLHGMPLAWLLGEDDDPLYGLTTGVIEPQHVVLIGVRSFEKEEKVRLERLGVRVVYMEEIRSRGIKPVMDEAIGIATRGTTAFGISIDLDVVSPDEAPGVGTPVRGGLTYREAQLAMEMLAASGKLRSLEVAEVNPILDQGNRTAALAVELVASALGQTIL